MCGPRTLDFVIVGVLYDIWQSKSTELFLSPRFRVLDETPLNLSLPYTTAFP